MFTKKWWKSKTLWFNALSIAIVIIQALTDTNYIPIEIQAPTMAIMNILLRSVTNKSLEK
jgi:hypothetical protein